MNRLSRAKIKYLASLRLKKSREEAREFIAEGKKTVAEGLKEGWKCTTLVGDADSLEEMRQQYSQNLPQEMWIADEKEIQSISSLENPEPLLAVFQMKEEPIALPEGKILLLENIRDPGNLGTIIRTADWFGIKTIIASEGTVDCFNPKVLRSSMGSVFRVWVNYYPDFYGFISDHAGKILAAGMEGENSEILKTSAFPYLLMGNEARGLSDQVLKTKGITQITIPGSGNAESLNVSVATGILCYTWCRRP